MDRCVEHPIEEGNIELREIDPTELPIVYSWTKRTPRLFTDDSPKTLTEFVDHYMRIDSTNGGVYRDGELVGLFVCVHFAKTLCEAHVFFKRSFLGWENTCPALRLGIQWAFNVGGYRKVGAPVLESNRLMVRLLEHLEGTQEAFFRAHVARDGKPLNVLYFSFFREG